MSPRPALPSGATMWERSKKVKQFMKRLLGFKPTTRGSNWTAIIYYLHYFVSNKLVHVHFGKHITITLKGWDALFLIPSPETIRRRRAEIQNAKEYNTYGSGWMDALFAGLKEDSPGVEWRWKYPDLRPSERTIIKRKAREQAVRNNYGSGYSLEDHMPIGVVSE